MIPAPDVGPPIGVCRGCGDEKLHNNVFEFEEMPVWGGGRRRKGLDRLFEAVAVVEATGPVFEPSAGTRGEPLDLDSVGGGLEPSFGADVVGVESDLGADDANPGSPPDTAKLETEQHLKVFAPRPGRERW